MGTVAQRRVTDRAAPLQTQKKLSVVKMDKTAQKIYCRFMDDVFQDVLTCSGVDGWI